jgi:hypothetical protein
MGEKLDRLNFIGIRPVVVEENKRETKENVANGQVLRLSMDWLNRRSGRSGPEKIGIKFRHCC